MSLFYLDDPNRGGTYVSQAPVMYGVGSAILSQMDRRLVDAVETAAVSNLYGSILSADIVDVSGILDQGIQDALAGGAKTTPQVVTDGDQDTIEVKLKLKPFNYKGTIVLPISADRN